MTTTQVRVESARAPYTIHIGQGLLDNEALWQELTGARPVFVVSNVTVWPLLGAQLSTVLPNRVADPFCMPDGENHKSMTVWQQLLDAMLASRLTRDAIVVALGGGVVGDLAGFAAASYMRGIDIIQAPTTLLAQVDSSVGGKTGINHPRGKNLIGAFHAPAGVVIDTNTLATLPKRQRAAGLAEVVKYGLIDDADFFRWLEQHGDQLLSGEPDTTAEAIAHSCRCKARVVAADEHERGTRALLNLGHTFGHALEAVTQYQHYLHGEAVAIGMLCAARLACHDNAMSDADYQRIESLLERFELPTRLTSTISADDLVNSMHGDKKADRHGLKGIALPAIGSAGVVTFDDNAALRRAWLDLGAVA